MSTEELPAIPEDLMEHRNTSMTSIFSEASSTPTAPTAISGPSTDKIPLDSTKTTVITERPPLVKPTRQTLKHKLSRDVLKGFLTGKPEKREVKPPAKKAESRGITKKKFNIFGMFKKKKKTDMKSMIRLAIEKDKNVNITNIRLPSSPKVNKISESPIEDSSSRNFTFDTTDYDSNESIISEDDSHIRERKTQELTIRKSQMSLGHFREDVLDLADA